MRNTGINHGSKLDFSLELRVQDLMGYINDLDHLELLTVAIEFLRFELQILVDGRRVKELTLALVGI